MSITIPAGEAHEGAIIYTKNPRFTSDYPVTINYPVTIMEDAIEGDKMIVVISPWS